MKETDLNDFQGFKTPPTSHYKVVGNRKRFNDETILLKT